MWIHIHVSKNKEQEMPFSEPQRRRLDHLSSVSVDPAFFSGSEMRTFMFLALIGMDSALTFPPPMTLIDQSSCAPWPKLQYNPVSV
jgi:hypothetical protein